MFGSIRNRGKAMAGRLGNRGAIGAAFAIGATVLLGMGALATEAGVWLNTRRNAQDAADAAAYAGLVRLSLNDATAAIAAATQVATRNGFTNTGALANAGDTRVVVQAGLWQNNTFTSPAPSGNSPNAVRVDINQVQRIGLTQLISRNAPIAWGGAIAVIEQGGPACTLSTPERLPSPLPNGFSDPGTTEIGGSISVTAPNCVMASNATGRKSFNIHVADGNAVTVGGLRASGQCYNCEDVNALGGYSSGAPITPNPYTYVDAWSMPNFNNSNCVTPLYFDAAGAPTTANKAVTIVPTAFRSSGANTYQPITNGPIYTTSRNTNTTICGDIGITSGQTLRLQPGTYFFNNSSLSMTGGAITCVGCTPGGAGITLVFTGDSANKVGNLSITGGDFTLIAPGTGSGNPSVFDGIVVYRDDLGDPSNATGDIMKIRGNPNSTVFGAFYVPTGAFEMLGNAGMNQTTAGSCLAIIAARILFSGNAEANIDACEANGTKVPRVRYVRFVL